MNRLKTLTRYVLKQALKPFFMGLAGFIVFVSVEWLYQISDYIIRNRVGIDKLLLFVMYNIPYFTFLGIPVGVLFSIFWVISDMYNNREITALLVHGVSAKHLVTPFIILALILGFFSWLLGDYVVPTANYKSSQILNQYIFQSPESVVKTNMLVELEKDVYFYVKEHNKAKGELYDVVLFRNEEGNEQILTAKKVIKRKDGWFLLDGSMYIVELETGFLKLDMQFKEMKLDVAGEIEEMLRAYKTTRDKTSKELREQLQTYKKLGINASNLIVELNQRYANALGALVIVLIGLPVSLLFGFISRSWSIILTFLIIVLYQGSGAWLSGMGKEGLMDPMLATWLPNIVFSVVGFIMYIFVDTPIAFKVREFLSRLFLFILIIVVFFGFTNSIGFSENLVKVNSLDAYFSEEVVRFKGEVSFSWDNYKLLCDEATATIVDGKIKAIQATGEIKFYDKDMTYTARSFKYDFESERALIVKAKVVYNYNYNNKKIPVYVYSSEINYEATSTLTQLEDSYLTTCNLEEPHYMILSSDVYVFENKYIVAKNSFLVILGAPIFPYTLYIMNLDGVPPYSFSITFGNTLVVSQSFNFAVNKWAVKLSFGTEGVGIETQNTQSKSDKISYNQSKDSFELMLSPFIYRYSKGNIYYKYDGPIYVEGTYINDNNFYHKLGFNYQNQNVYFRPYIMYDKKLTDTLIVLNGGIKNLSFDILPENSLKVNSVDSTYRMQYDGYLFEPEKDWKTFNQTIYNFSLANKVINYNISANGSVYNNIENRNITYTYQLPWNWKLDNFSLNFNYTFTLKNVYNYSNNTSKQSLGASDKYNVTGMYNIGPLKTSLSWEQVYNYLDEPTSTDRNLLKFTLEANSSNLTLSTSRSIDLIKNNQLPDTLTVKYNQTIGDFNIGGSLSTTYDNTLRKLGNENITLEMRYTPFSLRYALQFIIRPGMSLDNYVHVINYGNLNATIYQQNDYIKNIVASGSFNLFDYTAMLRANYNKTSKEATPTWNFTYAMEKKNEKYVLSYNTDNKNTYKLEMDLKNLDPNIKLSVTFNPSTMSFDYFSFNFDKSLHCWRLNAGIDFKNRNSPNIFDNIDKIYFKFYLTDIPDKFFQFDPKNGQFNFNGM